MCASHSVDFGGTENLTNLEMKNNEPEDVSRLCDPTELTSVLVNFYWAPWEIIRFLAVSATFGEVIE